VLFVGINPGMRSAATGHHFAGYSNRFWKLLFESGLVPERLTFEDDWRLPEFDFGMTNLVPRATPGIADLGTADYSAGRRRLLARIRRYAPRVVVLIGVTLYRVLQPSLVAVRSPDVGSGFSRIRTGGRLSTNLPAPLGLRDETLVGAPVFVLPNPSGRNANYSYAEMLEAFKELRAWLDDRR
jgi:double-stranded uracil-DNA glycosylase